MPKIKINDVNFYYEIHGENNPPIVFISGYTCDHSLWNSVIGSLSEEYRCLVFDNHGIGQTKDSGETLTAKTMAKNIVALFNSLGFEKPILVGYAMGSNLALQIAIDFPGKISKVILIDGVAKWSDFALKAIDDLFEAGKGDDPKIFFDLLIRYCFSENFRRNEKSLVQFKNQKGAIVQSVEDQLRQINVLKTFDVRNHLCSVKTPCIVLGLKYDVLATAAESKLLAEEIPNSKYIEVSTGHACLEEVSDLIAKLLKENVINE